MRRGRKGGWMVYVLIKLGDGCMNAFHRIDVGEGRRMERGEISKENAKAHS